MCCYCCHCCYKNRKQLLLPVKSKIDFAVQVEKTAPYSYDNIYQITDLEHVENSITEHVSTINNKVYTEQKAADIAYASSGTVLWTNKCDLYENTPGGPHAEVLMIQDNSLPYTITDIKIKNSPCYKCSQRLINYYKYYSNKPTIWIGQICCMNDPDDDNGLLNLMREGFTITVWMATVQQLKVILKT